MRHIACLVLGRGHYLGKSTMEAFVDHAIDRLVRGASAPADQTAELTLPGEPPRTILVRAAATGDGGTSVLLEDVSELRRLRRIRTEFIDNLSHELRTPLTTVRLLTESLAMEIEREGASPRVRDSVTKIDAETDHLVQMVNELLDLAKIEQGEAPLRLDDVDVGGIVEQTLERLRLYAERQGVSLRPELPAETGSRIVRGDAERLGQLLVNLVHNAVKFSPAGGEVMVRVRSVEKEVLIEVEDHGVGIPRRDLERVFERFYKVDRARADGSLGGEGPGSGCRSRGTSSNGMAAESGPTSEEGRGSTFAVALPAA